MALERGREAGDAELARRADWIRLKTVELVAQAGRDYRVFVLTGDGELQEGQVWESAMAAAHYQR